MRFDSFTHLLSHFALTTPDAPALRYGKTTLSYCALEEAIVQRAQALREGGRSCLGLLCDGSLENVIEIFAAVRAGLQLVLLDPALPAELLKSLMRYTDVDQLWGEEELCEELSPALMAGCRQASSIALTLLMARLA